MLGKALLYATLGDALLQRGSGIHGSRLRLPSLVEIDQELALNTDTSGTTTPAGTATPL